MSGTRHGISVSAITWDKEGSSIQSNETGGVDIDVCGYVAVSDSPTSLDDAVLLIPRTVPLSDDGPIGNCTRHDGAILTKAGAKYMGDDTIEVTANYQIANPLNERTDQGADSSDSDSDRAQRTIVTEQAPLLTHPVAMNFPIKDKRRLASLHAGNTWVNPIYDSDGADRELWEFITDTDPPGDIEEVTFSDVDVTVNGVTASPLDYARLIAAGVTEWRRPAIRHTLSRSRNEPAPNAEYGKVGEVISTAPRLAPKLTGGQWFLNGITDATDNGFMWNTQYEFEYTAQGGAIKQIYKDGNADFS